MEDLGYSVDKDIIEAATPELRQLLGIDLRYPERLDDAEAGNAEGKNS